MISRRTGGRLPKSLAAWLQTTSVAALVEVDRVCVLASPAAETMLGYQAGELVNVGCEVLAASDSVIAKREHQRLTRERFWRGDYFLNGADGRLIPVHSIAFARAGHDSPELFIHLYYPRIARQPAIGRLRELSSRDCCLLQLISEGLDDKDLGEMLGLDEETLAGLIWDAVAATQSRSRTEACVKAIKSGLVL